MSPIAQLALVVALLFYVEGVRYVPVGAVSFLRRPWDGYASRGPIVLRDGAASGFLLPGPWAPALERFVLQVPGEGAHRLDARALRRRMRLVRPALASAARLSWLLALNMFVAGPALGQIFGWAPVLLPWLLAQAVLTALVVRAAVRLARRLPGIAPPTRVETLLSLALYPPAALRFLDATFANALHGFDPLAAAAVLLDREGFARMARARLVEPGLPAEARGEIEGLLAREGVSTASVLAPPSRQADSEQFCPRCLSQYRSGVERCADCRDVTLVTFPS